VIEGVEKGDKRNCFQLVTPGKSMFAFADSRAEMVEWVR
jgi:hypothetical protein